jgi:signal transduction histidine kinase/pSer/pThr/pTyr-binding forkhead associated (FHA) protein
MATAFLKWTNADGGQETFALQDEEILVGRRSDSHIVFAYSDVSRRHAKFVKDGTGYSVLNLSEGHGTYVNGKRIERHQLQSGDRIRLGLGRIELFYLTDTDNAATTTLNLEPIDLEQVLETFPTILPPESAQDSQLARLSSVLDFQYQWERLFTSRKAFEHIVRSALKISGAERGLILLKTGETFEYVIGLDAAGRQLSLSEFHTSQSVAREVARLGEPIYMPEVITTPFAAQQSVLNLQLRSVACVPLRWLSAESTEPQVRGILYLDSTRAMRTISGADEKLLKKLALEAGNVFEKLEMIKTLEERKNLKLELDLTQNELLAAEALRRAEAQVLLSEYAASIGRFAAALSHEFNSPLGALRTALHSSGRLAEKKRLAPPEKQAELESIDAELRRTAFEAADRLNQIVLRMQRITNLDRDEMRSIDLNALLRDVTDLLRSGTQTQVLIMLELQPLPQLLVRPQQMSAVFSNLLQNAIDASGDAQTVKISTLRSATSVEITFQDDGRGMSADELAHLFDLSFKVKSGRVSTGNWGLFSSRQIVREHGGDIEIQSAPGQGTVVRITLPIQK